MNRSRGSRRNPPLRQSGTASRPTGPLRASSARPLRCRRRAERRRRSSGRRTRRPLGRWPGAGPRCAACRSSRARAAAALASPTGRGATTRRTRLGCREARRVGSRRARPPTAAPTRLVQVDAHYGGMKVRCTPGTVEAMPSPAEVQARDGVVDVDLRVEPGAARARLSHRVERAGRSAHRGRLHRRPADGSDARGGRLVLRERAHPLNGQLGQLGRRRIRWANWASAWEDWVTPCTVAGTPGSTRTVRRRRKALAFDGDDPSTHAPGRSAAHYRCCPAKPGGRIAVVILSRWS